MRLVLLALLLLPAVAHAAPLIPAVLAYLGYQAAALIATIALFAHGKAKARRMARQQRDAAIARLQDRTVTQIATEAPHVYIYGRAKVGSAIVAMITGGNVDQYKYLVCVHAAHECDAIEEIYVAGKALGVLDGNGDVTSGDYYSTRTEHYSGLMVGTSHVLPVVPIDSSVRVVSNLGEGDVDIPASYDAGTRTVSISAPTGFNVYVSCLYAVPVPRVRVRKHLGTPGEAADSMLLSEVPTMWSADHVIPGFCYTVIRLDLNQVEFQGGPPSVEPIIRGKKLYDFRTGATYWSENVPLAIYDYLTSEMCGVDAADLPLSQFIAAANVCDEAQWFGARYTMNGAVASDEDKKAVLERMAMAMAGEFNDTTWDIYAGKYSAPVMALYVDRPDGNGDVIGGIQITSGVPDTDLWNGVRGQYIGVETKYVATDFTPYRNSTYVTADGGELWTNIDFPFTNYAQRVHNICRVLTEDQRNGYMVKAEFSLKAWSVKFGQRVTLTSTVFGWNAKVFRIVNRRYQPLTGGVELTLKEDDPSIWDLADAVTADSTPNTNLPDPFAIAALSSLTCTSGTDELLVAQDGTIISRIRVSWPQATTQAVVSSGTIEIEWQKIGSGVWQKSEASGDATEAFLFPAQDRAYYSVRARCVNPYVSVKSNWVYAQDHKVVGKTAPPGDVAGFSAAITDDRVLLTWNRNSESDLAEYEIRRGMTWASASFVARMKTTGYKVQPLAAGSYTWLIKAFDTSDNESANAVSASATISVPAAPAVTVQVVATQVVIDWTLPTSSFVVSGYEIRHGDTWDAGTFVTKLQARTIALDVDWGTSRRFWVAAYDAAGNLGTPGSAILSLTPLSQPTVTAQVIDNNVLLSWTESTGSLPVKHYEVRKGATLGASELIGTLQGRFSTVFESSAGSYTYWVVPVDSANQDGTAGSTTTTVSQPPDFRLLYDQNSAFAGTKSSVLLEDGALVVPVNTTETFAQHFTTNGWASPQAQIDTGFPYYIQPGPASGYYEEVIDYGTTVTSTNITMTLGVTHIVAGVTITPKISVSNSSATGPWTDFSGVYQAFATNFRWVKFRLDFAASSGALTKLTQINYRMAFKTKSDAGSGTANAADAGGTTVNFNETFVDIESITVSAGGTAARYAIYDFTDVPNPTSFKVLLFDTTGARVSGPFSWSAKGV